MAQKFVVYNYNGNQLYLTGEITGPGGEVYYTWGSQDAILVEFDTESEANERAAGIGGGTVGTTRP